MTFFWVLSDFLSGRTGSIEITSDLIQGVEASDLVSIAADGNHEASGPALWMLLLLRLTAVASDERLELRNSAIQTLLRIFDAYGDTLSPEAWSICINSVIFKLLTSLEQELTLSHGDGGGSSAREDWNETAVVVLHGISSLIANYLDILMKHASFQQIWQQLIEHMTTLLGFGVLDINSAIFKTLQHIVAQTKVQSRPGLSKETVDLAWDLWSRGVPSAKTPEAGDNQASLTSYTDSLTEVYRLIESDLTVDRVQKILDLLRQTVEKASAGSYASDIEVVTQLQGRILSAAEMLRTDVEGVPSVMIKQISAFVALAFEHDLEPSTAPGSKRTFVAMSKASMEMLQKLILKHSADKDIYESGALSTALSALCIPISLKYDFPIVTKSTQPWKLATSTALAVLEGTLTQLNTLDLPQQTVQTTWSTIVTIADGILRADCSSTPSVADVGNDEIFDITSFHKLRGLIIPSLGNGEVQDKTRKAYAESLFKASIIHAPSLADESIVSGNMAGGLPALYTPAAGRTVSIPPTLRARMAYVALGELFSLVPVEHVDDKREETSEYYVRIACMVAPFLILRCGLTLRTHVADQPLRGHMPQPRSQRKELEWILEKLVALKSESNAIPNLRGVESENRKHLLRLYPLIVKAASIGGDGAVPRLLSEALEVVGGELGF